MRTSRPRLLSNCWPRRPKPARRCLIAGGSSVVSRLCSSNHAMQRQRAAKSATKSAARIRRGLRAKTPLLRIARINADRLWLAQYEDATRSFQRWRARRRLPARDQQDARAPQRSRRTELNERKRSPSRSCKPPRDHTAASGVRNQLLSGERMAISASENAKPAPRTPLQQRPPQRELASDIHPRK